MHRYTIPSGRILDIPIRLDYSCFLIFGLITWTMAVDYDPPEFNNWPVLQHWLIGAATAVMLLVIVLLHELGHSVVAMRCQASVRNITLIGLEPSRKSEVLKETDRDGVNQPLVLTHGQIQDILSREDAVRYLHTLEGLGV